MEPLKVGSSVSFFDSEAKKHRSGRVVAVAGKGRRHKVEYTTPAGKRTRWFEFYSAAEIEAAKRKAIRRAPFARRVYAAVRGLVAIVGGAVAEWARGVVKHKSLRGRA